MTLVENSNIKVWLSWGVWPNTNGNSMRFIRGSRKESDVLDMHIDYPELPLLK
jgi:hypothetical protein